MSKAKFSESKSNGNDSGLNFEAQLGAAAEQAVPAPHHDMTEYNCARPEGLCLGLIFLKYISDAFEEKREQLLFGFSDPIISKIGFNESAAKSKDVLGRVYEYFLGKFASAEGKGGGEFYTPQCVVQVLVAMLEPYKGCVFDPCCGSGGMFVQSEKFVEERGGRVGDIAARGEGAALSARGSAIVFGAQQILA